MNGCFKCGAPLENVEYRECSDGDGPYSESAGLQDCLLRQVGQKQADLANLHSLIRSVTRRLENARELLHQPNDRDVSRAAAEIDAVLEALS